MCGVVYVYVKCRHRVERGIVADINEYVCEFVYYVLVIGFALVCARVCGLALGARWEGEWNSDREE